MESGQQATGSPLFPETWHFLLEEEAAEQVRCFPGNRTCTARLRLPEEAVSSHRVEPCCWFSFAAILLPDPSAHPEAGLAALPVPWA